MLSLKEMNKQGNGKIARLSVAYQFKIFEPRRQKVHLASQSFLRVIHCPVYLSGYSP